MIPDILTQGQYDTVYNALSLVIASQLFTAVFLLISLPRVLPRYRQAITVALVVCGIAAYHYFRIFDSFKAAFVTDSVGGTGDYTQAAGASFNEGYRYVDWLLTVPLLLVELVAVLALARKVQSRLLYRLVPASALMIALGYPGEISGDNGVRGIFGILSTIPFAYILFVLFTQLSRSLKNQPAGVRGTLGRLRFLLLLSWGVYPIAYLLPLLDVSGADAWVGKQVGYSIADIVAKAVYALIILHVAKVKSYDDDHAFAAVETSRADAPEREAPVEHGVASEGEALARG
ncbi:bacteriorhodopsin [Rathayibacter oskolensis]|uniref:bacteriorhodopsin n=1 Tax=Rathayibacter TaxID=33886 RepID=UPI0013190874|nr:MULTISPECIES: bacteriorhodopsin [Rathayibacter]QHC66229.1 bacteriorhodopsin [Rathayibacter sp. VKM Ac-2759]WKK71007.1 bacteriorhodopsin [Rathayibacter oskolensis]